MAKRRSDPRVYRDETRTPKEGEWCLEIVLTQEDCEKLITGRVSRDLMESAWRALSWAREENKDWVSYTPPCLACAARRLKDAS